MTNFLKIMSVLILAIFSFYSHALPQQRMKSQVGIINGVVLDSASNNPIEYANIILISAEDSKMVTGITTGTDGSFELADIKPGKYFADVQFMGFEKKRIDNIQIGQNKWRYDLGKILLKSTVINIDAIYVEGERAPVSYQIDKKVVDVSQMQTVISGNAADVLQNMPSITVDANGTVSLRGSSDFTVLVDGRPSILDPQDALQQIPATSIKTIEIITNPSAKYSPEGTSGIINIILSKTENVGLTGVLNMNAGLNDKYGGDFLFEYKNNYYSLNFGADYNRRFSPGTTQREDLYTIDGNTSTVTSKGNNRWGREFWGVRGGVEFILGEKDILNFSTRIGSREMKRTSNLDFIKQSSSGNTFFTNTGIMNRGGNFYNFNTNYTHKFNQTGHEITSQLMYSYRTGDEISLTESFNGTTIIEGKKNFEKGPSKRLESKVQYTLPLTKKSKFEAGYEGKTENEQEITELHEFDTLSYSHQALPQFSQNTKTKEIQHSVYSLYSQEWGNLGIQGGIRGEYTYRLIELANQYNPFTIDDWNFFPTFHASYKLYEATQLMASYTRRIRRPWSWALEPFLTWVDANNVRKGNPALKNEYIDSYEVGAQTSLGKAFLSAEVYYRISHDKMEMVRSVYSQNVTLTTFENIGNDYSLGSELQLSYTPYNEWNLDIIGNMYKYKVEGILSNRQFSRESFNWRMSFNNTIKFSSTTQMQINSTYNSPTISSQGRQESYFTTDFSIRQDLFERTVSATLQVRDLFKTGKIENTTHGTGYYSYNQFIGESPMVMLSIKYFFNNYLKDTKRERPEEGMQDDDGF